MRVTVVRRTALAAAAVSVALLATACGGGQQDGGQTKAKDSAKPEKPVAKALSADELGELVLAEGDVEGHQVEKRGQEAVLEPGDIVVDKAACLPVAQVLSAVPAGEPAASVERVVVHESEAARKGTPSLDELAKMTEEDYGQPTAVIEAQEAKLG